MTWTQDAIKHGKSVFPEESCGLLVKIDGEEQYWECRNISAQPLETFVIDPDDWVKAEDISDEVVAVVHSHPKGGVEPSEADKESCEFFRWPFYIFDPEAETWNYLEPENYIVCPRLKESTNPDPNLRTIRLYGRLAREVGWKTLHADVDNVTSVLAYLNSNWPNLPYEKISQLYEIKIGDQSISEELKDLKVKGDVRIVPLISGSIFDKILEYGGKFLGNLIVSGGNPWIALGLTVLDIGIDLLSGDPDQREEEQVEMETNTIFSGTQNISKSGIPVPVIYGEVFTGSNVVSMKIHSAVEVGHLIETTSGIAKFTPDGNLVDLAERLGRPEPSKREEGGGSNQISLNMGSYSDPQIMEVIDLWGEGEIEGFPSAVGITNKLEADRAALKDVYFDGVPVLKELATSPYNVEEEYNIKNVSFVSRSGTVDQTPLPEAVNVSTLRKFNNPVNKASGADPVAVTKGIDNKDADELLIQLTWPSGMSDGVCFQIIVIMQGGVEVNALPLHHGTGDWSSVWANGSKQSQSNYINNNGLLAKDPYGAGKGGAIELSRQTTGVLTVDFRIDLNKYRSLKYDPSHPDYNANNPDAVVGLEAESIKIEKLMNDIYGDWRQTFSLTAITEIINKKPDYYYSAYGKLKVDSDAYRQVPKRIFNLRGTKVKIPAANTASVDARFYRMVNNKRLFFKTYAPGAPGGVHGLSVGDSITLTVTDTTDVLDGIVSGFDISKFNGIYKIHAVNDEDTFVLINDLQVDPSDSNKPDAIGQSGNRVTCTYKITPGVDSTNGRIIYPAGYVFNGTLTTTKYWCSDPAWILYDLLTTQRTIPTSLVGQKRDGYYDYGLGRDIDETIIDKYSLFEASKYASELVHGEPRFSCNVVLKEPKQVYKVISDICSCLRAKPYYASGKLQLSIDKPGNPVYLFTRSNVTEDGFSYGGSPVETRYTVVNVAYFNNDLQQKDYVTVEAKKALTDKYGYRVKNVTSFACNSRAQAERMGRWVIHTQNYEGEVVTFSSSLHSGVLVRPGQVVSIADPLRAENRIGGRIASVASTTVFTIDDSTNTFVPAADDSISVLLPTAALTTGSNVPYGKVETRTIDSVSGTTITVDSAFSEAPVAGATWVATNYKADSEIKPIDYRILGVSEDDDLNYVFTAMRYDASKYDEIEAPTESSDG